MSPKKKICFFMSSLAYGGAQKVIITLANSFSDYYLVDLYIGTNLSSDLLFLVSPKVNLILLECKSIKFAFFPFFAYLSTIKPDYIITRVRHNNIFCILTSFFSLSDTKVIIGEANIFNTCVKNRLTLFMSFLMRFTYPFAHRIIANSYDTKSCLASLGISSRVSVVSNPIDFNSFRASPTTHSGAQFFSESNLPSTFIVSTGRFIYQKGFDILIRAFAEVLPTYPDLFLVLIGSGSDKSFLESLISSLGITHRVIFTGYHPNPSCLIKHASIFVLPSRWEGFGNVLIEALSTGVHVISSDCPGAPKDILSNANTGFLFESENLNSLVCSLRHLLSSNIPSVSCSDTLHKLYSSSVIKSYYEEFISDGR